VEGALLLDDGRIVVADRGSAQVRFYDSAGVFQNFVGGPGDGPGELGYIRGLGRCGADSIYVWELDYQNVVFSSEGEYVREARPYPMDSRERRPYALRCATNGYYAAVGWENLDGPPTIGFYRAEANAWILGPDYAQIPDPLAVIPNAGLVIAAELGTVLSSERVGHTNGSRPHPFGRATRVALTSDAVYMGTGEGYEIRQYALDGSVVRITRWTGSDLSITDADLEAYRAAALANVPDAARPAVERDLRDLPLPSAFPAFEQIETDGSGRVWVKQFQRPTAPGHAWTILDTDGAWLGSVQLPTDFEVTYIASDVVLGIARDDLGVERIRVYDIVKP
jgi:hypothetical protein